MCIQTWNQVFLPHPQAHSNVITINFFTQSGWVNLKKRTVHSACDALDEILDLHGCK